MSRTDDIYKPALVGKKIPVLTLDNKWHHLFTQAEPDKHINRLVDELNELVKRQGKANTEIKEIKKLKKKLMQEIVENASEASLENDLKAQKKADESKRLINECNEKIEAYEDELLELPGEIDRVNRELMLATMEICYDRLKENGFQGGLTIVKDYISKHKELVPPKRQLVVSQGSRGQRYHTAPGESYQMDWG